MPQIPKPPITRTFTTTLKGLVPAPGSTSGRALLDDGTWGTVSNDTFDIHNVRDYGATGDGTTDDTSSIQDTIDAAEAAAISTGRMQWVYFPGGEYACNVRVGVEQFSIDGISNIGFIGPADGHRARILQNGNGGGANWHLFHLEGGASNIEFRNLILDQDGITGTAEQQHLIQIGDDVPGPVRIIDCVFQNTASGDGIRLLGEFGAATTDVQIQRCVFFECGRSSISLQRWVRGVNVKGCHFYGGTDQAIDSEPTGTAHDADAGSDATHIVELDGPDFTTWDLQVGDPILNTTELKIAKVTAITDGQNMTTTAAVTNWLGDQYTTLRQQYANIFEGNYFWQGDNTTNLRVTLTHQSNCMFVGNFVQGCLQAGNLRYSLIANNIFDNRNNDDHTPPIQLINGSRGCRIVSNRLWINTLEDPITDITKGINVTFQGSEGPKDILIALNEIYAFVKCTAIAVSGCSNPSVIGNTIVLNTPGETGDSVGIQVASANGFAVSSALIANNTVYADSGAFTIGITVDAITNAVTQCAVTDNNVSGSTTDYKFREVSGGTFTHPPYFSGLGATAGITVPPSLPWLQLAGLGGSAATTSSLKPAVYWGTGSPEGVLAAGIGAIAMRSNGSAGTQTYFKTANTTNTGWVPTGGVVATGTIVCTTKANYADTDFMTIGDGITAPKRYDFDTAGDGDADGIVVNISTDTTATEVADRLKTAIEANQPLFTVVNNTGTLTLTHKIPGTFANVTITENVTHVSHTVTGMTGGVNPP